MKSLPNVVDAAMIALGLFAVILLLTACATTPPQPFGENIWKALPYGQL